MVASYAEAIVLIGSGEVLEADSDEVDPQVTAWLISEMPAINVSGRFLGQTSPQFAHGSTKVVSYSPLKPAKADPNYRLFADALGKPLPPSVMKVRGLKGYKTLQDICLAMIQGRFDYKGAKDPRAFRVALILEIVEALATTGSSPAKSAKLVRPVPAKSAASSSSSSSSTAPSKRDVLTTTRQEFLSSLERYLNTKRIHQLTPSGWRRISIFEYSGSEPLRELTVLTMALTMGGKEERVITL